MGFKKRRKGGRPLITTLRTEVAQSRREVDALTGCADVDAYERRYLKIGRKWGLMPGNTPPIVNKR